MTKSTTLKFTIYASLILTFLPLTSYAATASSTPSTACTYPNNQYIRTSSNENWLGVFTLPTTTGITITDVKLRLKLNEAFNNSSVVTVSDTSTSDCSGASSVGSTLCTINVSGSTSALYNCTLSGSYTAGQTIKLTAEGTNQAFADSSPSYTANTYLDVTYTVNATTSTSTASSTSITVDTSSFIYFFGIIIFFVGFAMMRSL